jgi:hypothetical protein
MGMKKGYFDESSQDWVVPIKDEYGNMLDLRKGRMHSARDKSNPSKKLDFKIRRLVWGQHPNLPEMVSFIAEIQWSDGDEISCWLCYYILNRYGKWAFGQFGPMMPSSDLKELYEYANEKGIL